LKLILSGKPFIPKDIKSGKILSAKYAELPHYKSLQEFKLTKREAEVLRYLVSGSTNKHIARVLDIEIVTVKIHVRSICKKMKVGNRMQAALIAQEIGIKPAR
jgi:two-component system nitrate/nitrite response regulator NarL